LEPKRACNFVGESVQGAILIAIIRHGQGLDAQSKAKQGSDVLRIGRRGRGQRRVGGIANANVGAAGHVEEEQGEEETTPH